MKRIYSQVAIAFLSLAGIDQAFAIANGFYLGLALGPATNGAGEQQAQKSDANIPNNTTPVDARSTQVASRFFMGNQFSPYAAFEFGLDFFSKIKYDSHGVETCGEASNRIRAADIAIKGILPLSYFNVFAKGGVAMTYITTAGALNPETDPADPTRVKCSNSYTNKFSGVYGVGASYDINQSWVADISYTTMQVSGVVSTVSALTLGISYHFTDKYCGQFLCDG